MKELTINCLCRVCLKQSHLHKNIYEDQPLDEFLVYELLNDVCDLGISVDDGLPEFICVDCFGKIIEFKSFKTKAHMGRSTFLLLKDRVEYPIIKHEELEISADEFEEQVDPIFGPILLKDEILTVYNNMHEEEVTESEISVSVDSVESPATYMEDSTQEADGDDSGSELCEVGAFREESSDSDMEPLMLESEEENMDSVKVLLPLVEADTHPEYPHCLENIRPNFTSNEEIEKESCTWSKSTMDELIFEKTKNSSLSEEVEASSSKTMERLEYQRILPGESVDMAPLTQQERVRMEQETGGDGESWRGTGRVKGASERREGLECFHCGIVLMSKPDLIQHMKVHGFGNFYECSKPYKCAECSKCISNGSNLKTQMRLHTYSKPYKCAECSKSFSLTSTLKRHMRIHTGSKPYICSECSKSFSENGSLKRHMRIHTGYKPYICSECSKSFSENGSLKRHMRIHTGYKPYICSECSKSFSENCDLNKHMRIHTGYKPYICSECSKRFCQNGNLKKHMRIHTGSKPYICSECSKSFSQNCDLHKHMRIHTGYKPYICSECSKRFSQNGNLKIHMRLHRGSKL